MPSETDHVSGTASESTHAENVDAEAIAEAVAQKLQNDDKAEDIEDKRPEWVFAQFTEHWRADGKAQSGLQSYSSSWGQFCEWMDEQEYVYLTDLTPRFPGQHDSWIVSHDEYDQNELSRCMHLSRIKNVIRYAESRGWIDPTDVPEDETWDTVKPDLDADEKVRSDPLPPERGEQIMNWVRANRFGNRAHVLWIALFRYGFRVSAIRALDRDSLVLSMPEDMPDDQRFRPHLNLDDRPELGPEDDDGLPLKNKRDELAGRRVPLKPEHAEVFRHYVENGSPTGAKDSRKEHDEPDEYGLSGLLTGEQSARLSGRTIRERTHWLTCPTTFTDRECQCDGCRQYRDENGRNPYPSKVGKHCNETRSPHQVRHGAITSLLDDHDHATVARIVGTSTDTIREVYDSAGEYRRMNRIAGDWLSD